MLRRSYTNRDIQFWVLPICGESNPWAKMIVQCAYVLERVVLVGKHWFQRHVFSLCELRSLCETVDPSVLHRQDLPRPPALAPLPSAGTGELVELVELGLRARGPREPRALAAGDFGHAGAGERRRFRVRRAFAARGWRGSSPELLLVNGIGSIEVIWILL